MITLKKVNSVNKGINIGDYAHAIQVKNNDIVTLLVMPVTGSHNGKLFTIVDIYGKSLTIDLSVTFQYNTPSKMYEFIKSESGSGYKNKYIVSGVVLSAIVPGQSMQKEITVSGVLVSNNNIVSINSEIPQDIEINGVVVADDTIVITYKNNSESSFNDTIDVSIIEFWVHG